MSTERNTTMRNRTRQDIVLHLHRHISKKRMAKKKTNISGDITWGTIVFRGNPEKVYREILSIGETATPQEIVDYARANPESELNKCFDWDDQIAAEKWRKQQARIIVCNLVVRKKKNDVYTGQVYRVIQENRDEQAYKPVVFTLRNQTEYEALLAQAKKELESFRYRYQRIVEMASVIREIDSVLAG